MTATNERFTESEKMRPWQLITLSRRDPSAKSDIIAFQLAISQYRIFLLQSYSTLDLTFANGQKLEWTFYPMSEKKPSDPNLSVRSVNDNVFLVRSYNENPADECIKETKYCCEIFKVDRETCTYLSMDLSQIESLEKLTRIVSEFPDVHLTMAKCEEKHLEDVMAKLTIGRQLAMISYPETGEAKDPSDQVQIPATSSSDSSDSFRRLSCISSSGLNAFLKHWTASSDTSKRSFNILTGDFLDKKMILEGLETKPFDEEHDYYSFHYTPTSKNAVKITNSVGVSATVVVNNVSENERYFVFMVDGFHDKI